eukprot:3783948-Amphidinium_carterae.1
MVEWLLWHGEQFAKAGLGWSDMVDSVCRSNMELRKNVSEMLDIMQTEEFQLLVFSAGSADVIEEFFRQSTPSTKARLGKNIHVVSNRIRFASNGTC